MTELGSWTRNLILRCQEVVGEVGEEAVYAAYRRQERLAPAFCHAAFEARYFDHRNNGNEKTSVQPTYCFPSDSLSLPHPFPPSPLTPYLYVSHMQFFLFFFFPYDTAISYCQRDWRHAKPKNLPRAPSPSTKHDGMSPAPCPAEVAAQYTYASPLRTGFVAALLGVKKVIKHLAALLAHQLFQALFG